MTRHLTIWHLVAASLCAVLLIGCGSSSKTVPLLTHLSVVDSLQKELVNSRTQNGTLTTRISRMEMDKKAADLRLAECDSTVNFLKTQIGRTQAPPPEDKAPVQRLAPAGAASYETALELFREKRYTDAAAMFQSLLEDGVDEKLQDNCRYWLGESEFGAKQYAEAIENFRKIASFEKSEKKDESQLMIARSFVKMGKTDQAKAEYQKFIDTFPASPYLAQAKEQMAKLK
jgi:TolA-binding protein